MKSMIKQLIPSKLHVPLKSLAYRILYAGSNVHCKLCDSTFRRFIPYGLDFPILQKLNVVGGGRRPHAACPGCGSTDRERLVWLYLLHELNIKSKSWRVLHIAPEKSLHARLSKFDKLEILTADISGKNVMLKVDITAISLDDSQFDLIICNHVLEHIIDDRKAMQELYRVLKPGGFAVLQVPISMSLKDTYEDSSVTSELEREKIFGQNDHVRIYGSDYADRLRSVGFHVELFRWWTEGENYRSDGNRYGLLTNETLFAIRKNANS